MLIVKLLRYETKLIFDLDENNFVRLKYFWTTFYRFCKVYILDTFITAL